MWLILLAVLTACLPGPVVAKEYVDFVNIWPAEETLTPENVNLGLRQLFQIMDNEKFVTVAEVTKVEQNGRSATIDFIEEEIKLADVTPESVKKRERREKSVPCSYIFTSKWICTMEKDGEYTQFDLQRAVPATYEGIFDTASMAKLAARADQRKPLLPADQAAIADLLRKSPPKGALYASDNIKVEYLKLMNDFFVEIESLDIMAARQEITDWFVQQGFSQDAICNTVEVNPSPNVASMMEDRRMTKSALPNGC